MKVCPVRSPRSAGLFRSVLNGHRLSGEARRQLRRRRSDDSGRSISRAGHHSEGRRFCGGCNSAPSRVQRESATASVVIVRWSRPRSHRTPHSRTFGRNARSFSPSQPHESGICDGCPLVRVVGPRVTFHTGTTKKRSKAQLRVPAFERPILGTPRSPCFLRGILPFRVRLPRANGAGRFALQTMVQPLQ